MKAAFTHREFDHERVHDAADDGYEVERVPAVLEVALPRNEGQCEKFHCCVPFKPY